MEGNRPSLAARKIVIPLSERMRHGGALQRERFPAANARRVGAE
jgi:hypothetical protein